MPSNKNLPKANQVYQTLRNLKNKKKITIKFPETIQINENQHYCLLIIDQLTQYNQ